MVLKCCDKQKDQWEGKKILFISAKKYSPSLLSCILISEISTMKLLYIFLVMFSLLWLSCNQTSSDSEAENDHAHGHHHVDANAYMHQRSFEELVANFESPERLEWQKPDSVIAMMGDISGKTVMDIGCGTGYFSVRLAEKGAKVICADVDEEFQAYVDQRKEEEGYTDEQIETRMIPYDSPGLSDSEADYVMIIDTYHHIENREDYFRQVRQGLKEMGKLMVIDFEKRETPHGPPLEMRISADQVVEELKAAGFDSLEINTDLLPYQYIIIGS